MKTTCVSERGSECGGNPRATLIILTTIVTLAAWSIPSHLGNSDVTGVICKS
jgi:hypothetical protein